MADTIQNVNTDPAPRNAILTGASSKALPAGLSLLSMSKDRKVFYAHKGGEDLWQSTDYGTTWTVLKTFPGYLVRGLVFLASGEVLVAATEYDMTSSHIYRSSGWATNPATATWTETLVTTGGRVEGGFNFGQQCTSGQVVVVAESGPQTTSSGDQTGAGRRVYLSTNSGASWSQILDIYTYVGGLANIHLHSVCYDADWDRIWVTWGDNQASSAGTQVLWSDNRGATWTREAMPAGWWETGAYAWMLQETAIWANSKVVFGLPDGQPYSINVRRKTGYRTTSVLQSTCQMQGTGNNVWQNSDEQEAPILAAATGTDRMAPSIAASPDGGLTWVEVWRGSTINWADCFVVGPAFDGRIYWCTDVPSPLLWSATLNLPTLKGSGATRTLSGITAVAATPVAVTVSDGTSSATTTVTMNP